MKVPIVVLIIAAVRAMAGPTNPSESTSKAVLESTPTGKNAEPATGTSQSIQAASETAPAKETTIDGATTSETAGQEGTAELSLAEALNSDAAEISSDGEAQTVNEEAEGSSIFHHNSNNNTETEDGNTQGRHILSFLGSGQRNRFG